MPLFFFDIQMVGVGVVDFGVGVEVGVGVT